MPTGGNGTYSFQWEKKVEGSSVWSAISGATSSGYNPPAGQTETTDYRRRETSCGQTVYTDSKRVSVIALPNLYIPESVENDCGSTDIILTARSSGIPRTDPLVKHRWYNHPTLPNFLDDSSVEVTSASTYTTQVVVTGQNRDYWVSTIYNGCESSRQKVSAVYTEDVVPTFYVGSTNSLVQCGSIGTFNLVARGNSSGSTGTFEWYDVAIGGVPVHTGDSFPVTMSEYERTYYVGGTLFNSKGCSYPIADVDRWEITVTLNPIPGLASASNPSPRCGPGTITFTATPGSNGNSIKWYTASSGGTLLNPVPSTSYTTPTALTGTTTYYAATYNTATECEDTDRVAVTVTINPVPGLASASNPSPRCGPGTVTFNATPGSNGNSIKWYTAASGGTLLNPVPSTSYTTPTALTGTTTYYAATYNTATECEDTDRVAVTAVVNTTSLYYADTDGDGFGDPTASTSACSQPAGHVPNNDDYDDSTVNITNIPPQNFYADTDDDGFGDPNNFVFYSVQPNGYLTDNTDCNDNDTNINPNTIWYADNIDQDGLGDPNSPSSPSCTPPAGYVADNTDACPTINSPSNACNVR